MEFNLNDKININVPLNNNNEEIQDQEQEIYTILTYNMFLRPPLIKNNKDDMKNERTKLFLDTIGNFDFVCLQEVFAFLNQRKHKLIYSSMKQGFYHHAQSRDPTFLEGTLVDGGLLTLSKKPIVYDKFMPYNYGVLSDNIALKGILYTKIYMGEVNDTPIYLHLFNTHLQASYIGKENEVKATIITRVNQLRTLRNFINEMLQENKFNPELEQCLVVGDYNVNANGEGIPVRFLNGKIYQDIIDNLNLHDKETFQEYDMLIGILSNYGEDYLYDTLKTSYGGKSPITYGDSVRDENGEIALDHNQKEIPRETVLTNPEDFGSKQCLDYIMEYCPGGKIQKKQQSLQYIEKSTEVQPFFCNEYYKRQDITVTQMSDHYGVSCQIKLNK